MKLINKTGWISFEYLFICIIFLFCFANGLNVPKAKAAKGKQEDCKSVKAILTEHGYARGQYAGSGPESLSPTNTYTNYTDIRVLESGNRVPLEDGSIIYFSYKIQNLPKDKTQIDGFKILLTFPEITNPSGKKYTSYQSSFSVLKQMHETLYENEHYWSFSNSDPYEMVEGPFTYHLYYKSCLLLEYSFYTYRK